MILIQFLKLHQIICENSSDLLSNQRLYSNINGIFKINNCFFIRTTIFSGNGGIVLIENKSSQFQIVESIFSYISITGSGGAIYFNNNLNNVHSTLNKVCGDHCNTGYSGEGQFSYILVNNDINSFNIINDNSIMKSSPFINNGYDIYYLKYGNQTINNLNSSFNNNRVHSGFSTYFPNFLNGIFSTFINNSASSHNCISFNGNFQKYWRYSNILYNDSPVYEGVINNWSDTVFLSNCIIKFNKDILFHCQKGTFYITNCSIIHLFTFKSTYSTAQIITNDLIFQTFSTFNFNYYCDLKQNGTIPKMLNIKYFSFIIIFIN